MTHYVSTLGCGHFGGNLVGDADPLWAPMAPVPLPFEFGAGCMVAQALGDALGFLVDGEHPAICQVFVDGVFAAPDPRPGGAGFGIRPVLR